MQRNIKTGVVLVLSLMLIGYSPTFACGAPSKDTLKTHFYSYEKMTAEIKTLVKLYPQLLTVVEKAPTDEGRSIVLLEVGNKTENANGPGLMAVFAQHSGEHATTKVAMGFLQLLLSNYGKDAAITKLLNEKKIYIVPMANPDGVAYNFNGLASSEGAEYNINSGNGSLKWRKNRKPVDKNSFGVDLNRNWGYKWDAPTTDALARSMSTPDDLYYHGDRAFSENETIVLRDFILNHKNIKLFVDYHAGASEWMQGDVIIPYCYTDDSTVNQREFAKYKFFSDKFAEIISNSNDKRVPFTAMQAFKVKEFVLKNTPILLKPFVRASMPASTLAPGSAIDWVAAQGILAFGVEMLCKDNFVSQMPVSQEILTQKQYEGFLFLLNML